MTFRKASAVAILKISGLERAGRAQQIRRAAEMLDGIIRLDINYIGDTATIEYDTGKLTLAQVESINHSESSPTSPRVVADPTRGSTAMLQKKRRVHGTREKGDVNSALRRRGRYSRTQRGRLGE